MVLCACAGAAELEVHEFVEGLLRVAIQWAKTLEKEIIFCFHSVIASIERDAKKDEVRRNCNAHMRNMLTSLSESMQYCAVCRLSKSTQYCAVRRVPHGLQKPGGPECFDSALRRSELCVQGVFGHGYRNRGLLRIACAIISRH